MKELFYCPTCKKYTEEGRFCGVCGSPIQKVAAPQEKKVETPQVKRVEIPSTPLTTSSVKGRRNAITTVGIILLSLYIVVSFLMGLHDGNEYIRQCESRLGGVVINVSKFWYYLILGISVVLFIAAMFGSKSFSITSTALIGVLLVFVIIMAVNTEEGYHGLSVNWMGGSLDFDKDSELSKALAYNYYGMAALKVVWLWAISFVLIIIGRTKEAKSVS